MSNVYHEAYNIVQNILYVILFFILPKTASTRLGITYRSLAVHARHRQSLQMRTGGVLVRKHTHTHTCCFPAQQLRRTEFFFFSPAFNIRLPFYFVFHNRVFPPTAAELFR